VIGSGRWENGNLVEPYALDTNRFPFDPSSQVAAAPVVDPARAERERLAAEAEAERRKRVEAEARQEAELEEEQRRRQELEQRLLAEAKQRERQAAEAEQKKRIEAEARQAAELEAEQRRRQELEQRRLAEAKERERQAAEAEQKKRIEAEARQAAELEAERRKRQELEERLLAEAKERERLLAEAKERERVLAEAKEREKVATPQRPQAALKPERRVALVIGNAGYKTNPLVNPGNDAIDIATALGSLGFETTLVRDATIGQMREVTRKFADAVALSDVALIFYAGHGLEVKGRNYLIPVTADIKHEYELEDQAYDAGRWLDMLEGMKSLNRQRVNIVILDACRDNVFSRGWRNASRGLARMDAPTGTFIAFATAPGKVAADGERQRNSPFTKSLLKAIQQPNLPIELMFKEVRRMVLEETKGEQVPWDNSSLVGDFAFRR